MIGTGRPRAGPAGPTWRLASATLAAMAMLGSIGLLRHRRERAQVRAGRQAPVHAATRTAPPGPEGPLARRLARWVPAAPRTRLGRAAAAVWSGPSTLVGVVAGLTTGGAWRRDDRLRCWIVAGGTRGAARLQRWLGFGASAVGQVVLSRAAQPPSTLLAHEAVHVRQSERLGPLIVPLYLWYYARYGYRDHPLERAARWGAERSTSPSRRSRPAPHVTRAAKR